MTKRWVFVTGKLAESALRRQVEALSSKLDFEPVVVVLPISVVALANIDWIARHFDLPKPSERVILPGLCSGELSQMISKCEPTPVERGPADLRDLPEYLGAKASAREGYGPFDIQILAEINHAPRLAWETIHTKAIQAQRDGADLIDLGCDPHGTWEGIGDTVRRLRDLGIRVSIDSFNPREVELGVKAGAELVLSVNRANCERAKDWGCEVVAVPDTPAQLDTLEDTINVLTRDGVRFRIDPILEPIGFGFAASLGRYLEVRSRYPQAEMMMGVGNLTELTDVDSAGINVLLTGFCQEVGIRSVLTTEVISWARSSVRELDLARRLMLHAAKNGMLPKRLEPDLVMLRDPKLFEHGADTLCELASKIRDRNFRLFAEAGLLHVMNVDMHLTGQDPFALFAKMIEKEAIDPSHAFYLGYEMCKAMTALTLGKNYVQDQALRWGFLTRPEKTRHEREADAGPAAPN